MKEKKVWLQYIMFALPIILALVCIISVANGNAQSSLPVPMPQEFIGEYSYDEENWLPLTEESDLSALKGDLTLRGHFLREMQEGWYLSFYRNHIGVAVQVNGETIYTDARMEFKDKQAKLFAVMCGRDWAGISCPYISTEDTVEIRLYNPHSYGNRTAYRDFLDTLCSDMPEWNFLQMNLQPHGKLFRVWGGLLIIASLMLLGAAIAAVAARVGVGRTLFELGMLTLMTGGYVALDTIDVVYWNDLIAQNTYASQLCMILAVFCFEQFVSERLSGRKGKAAKAAVAVSAVLDCVLIALSIFNVMVLYDALLWWVISQLILCPLLITVSAQELRGAAEEARLVPISAIVMCTAILLDIAGVGATIVWRAPCAKVAFIVLFVVHIVAGAGQIVKNHRASIRAAKLEQELENSRVAIMLSQIKPHFLYNVLNAIYHLYRKEPETAQEAVSSFAEYLRCNMLSIEKRENISFSEEYQHIQTYLSLEQIRFRNKLDVVYDVEVTDFKLPPLTVEPLVENAVKHGVTKRRGGGTVIISTRKTEDGYVITVADTGIGFDPNSYGADGKPHVGIRNVRERLQSMAGGELSIYSTSDGTVATVTIPAKEENHRYEDHCGG